jgi:hypothetical protein
VALSELAVQLHLNNLVRRKHAVDEAAGSFFVRVQARVDDEEIDFAVCVPVRAFACARYYASNEVHDSPRLHLVG